MPVSRPIMVACNRYSCTWVIGYALLPLGLIGREISVVYSGADLKDGQRLIVTFLKFL